MEKITYLIEKFWQGNASTEEKRALIQLLEERSDDWKAFSRARFKNDQEHGIDSMHSGMAAEILKQLHAKINDPVTAPATISIFRKLRWVAAAAVLVIMAGMGIFQLINKEIQPAEVLAGQHPTRERTLTIVENLNKENKIITLSDGSVIKLYGNSTVSYLSPFDSTDRNITLIGSAYFNVAKSKEFQFTVTSGTYTTTALGTAFEVNMSQSELVNVKLFEGKVIVQSLPESNFHIAGTYLKPGQQLSIDGLNQKHLLTNIYPAGKSDKNEKKSADIKTATKLRSMDFHKTSLKDIFRYIEDNNNIVIQFNENELKGLTFTGSFPSDENYKTVLSIICSMNDLTLTEQGDTMVIQKSQ